MTHSKDLKEKLHITYMNVSKAFNVVEHDGIMNHLEDQGINICETL